MVSIKNNREIELMKIAGKINYETHKLLQKHIKPGVTTKQLDTLAHDYITSQDATCSFLNYEGFPASICTSINEEVVHGIPSFKKLKNGDIISIDIGVNYKGYHSDSAWTYPVGKIDEEVSHLLKHTEAALYEGIKEVKAGVRLNNIGAAIEKYALAHNLGVVKELVGHGVGQKLHEDPDVPNYGKYNTGMILKAGMTIAIEPMLTSGTEKIYILDDDWTIITRDNKPAAHFEHTVLVTEDGYKILTGDE